MPFNAAVQWWMWHTQPDSCWPGLDVAAMQGECDRSDGSMLPISAASVA